MANAPALANTLRTTIMQLVDHIKAAMSSDEEEPAAKGAAAPVKP